MGLIKNLLNRGKLTRMAINLQRQTELLTKKDIGDWRNAWQLAINVENPNRNRLYEIYTDVAVDPHVSGCIEQRKGMAKKVHSTLTIKQEKQTTKPQNYCKKSGFKIF